MVGGERRGHTDSGERSKETIKLGFLVPENQFFWSCSPNPEALSHCQSFELNPNRTQPTSQLKSFCSTPRATLLRGLQSHTALYLLPLVQQVDESSAQEVNPEINPSIVHEGSASSLAVLGEARALNQEQSSSRRRRRRVDALRWVIPPPAPPGWGWRGEGRIIVTAGAGHRVFAIFPGQREVRVLVRVDSNGVQTIVRSPGRQRRHG